jgi:hypothetical protein
LWIVVLQYAITEFIVLNFAKDMGERSVTKQIRETLNIKVKVAPVLN